MKRWVYAYRVVDGEPAVLDQVLRERMHDLVAPGATPAVDGSFALRLAAGAAGVDTTKEVRARTGVAESIDTRTRIPVSWHAEPARHAFPAFEGAFELEPLSDRHAQLTLVGAYRVPFGPLGAAADGLALGAVAQQSIADLVERVGQRLAGAGADDQGPAEPVPQSPLRLQVADVMTPDPMLFDEQLSLRTAALLLVYRGVQGAPVVSDTGALVGVLSEHDLLEKEAAFRPYVGRDARDRQRRRSAVTVGEACSRPARVTVPGASLRDAARTMLDRAAARLVVVDGSAIVGIITRHDVLKALLRSDAELQAAVDALLATLSEPHLRAQVVWGEVTLGGTVTAPGVLPHLVRMIAEVDGVVAVHGQPRAADGSPTAELSLRGP